MDVNLKVDNSNGLMEVPGLDAIHQRSWKIRLLKINGKSLALSALAEWEKSSNGDYRKIMKAMKVVGNSPLPPRLPHVVKSDNYEVYEMRGDNLRLMFFYDKANKTVVCTNSYEKNSSSNQGTAFGTCDRLMTVYTKFPLTPNSL